MPFQIQVRGRWGGVDSAEWRPAVVNDAKASTFATEHDAAIVLENVVQRLADLLEEAGIPADPEFRIVEVGS